MQASPEDYRLTTLVMVASVVITLLIVSAVSTNSVELGGMPAMAWCAAIVFGIQWLAWIPASLLQSERFYDLTGGMTYIVAVVFSLWAGSQSDDPGTRELLISALVAIWSLRLSAFLFLDFIYLCIALENWAQSVNPGPPPSEKVCYRDCGPTRRCEDRS